MDNSNVLYTMNRIRAAGSLMYPITRGCRVLNTRWCLIRLVDSELLESGSAIDRPLI